MIVENALKRTITRDCNAVHFATIAGVVVQRIVQHRPVVPKRDCPPCPAKATSESLLAGMLEQVFQQGCTFLFGHVLEARW